VNQRKHCHVSFTSWNSLPLYIGRGRAPFEQNKMPITTLNLETASSDSTSRRALSQLSLAVAKSRRIVVVTGAGISCSSGIPVSIGLSETTTHVFPPPSSRRCSARSISAHSSKSCSPRVRRTGSMLPALQGSRDLFWKSCFGF